MTIRGEKTSLKGLIYDPSRHGQPRWYVRRAGGRKVRLKGHDAFAKPPPLDIDQELLTIYQAAWVAAETPKPPSGPAMVSGTLRWLCEVFCQDMQRRVKLGTMAELTVKNRRSVLTRICDTELKPGRPVGEGVAERLTPLAVRNLRDAIADRPAAARDRVRIIRALYGWAIEAGHVTHNPANGVALPRQRSGGFTPWTVDQVRQWMRTYPLGTMPRLAMDLLLYTMQRRSDVILLGPAHEVTIEGERWLSFVQVKNQTQKPVTVEIPIMPPLAESIAATAIGAETYLVTEHGKPFASSNSFGNKFRDWRAFARLPDGIAAHGIRKAGGGLLASCGCTGSEIDAILGHEDAGSGRIYVKSADRRRLAKSGMEKLRATLSEG